MTERGKRYTPVFCNFLLYKARPAWYELDLAVRAAVAAEVEDVLADARVRRRGVYSLVGFREDADLMIWASAPEAAGLQAFAASLRRNRFAGYFETVAVYPALAKVSPYTGAHVPAFLRGVAPQRFVCMYPFVKTHEWYQLPFEDRRRMMETHGQAGAQWPQVFTNTLYAFGLHDYEFVLAFETAEPADFVFLLERLREVEVRRYTLRDTPIYLAARKPLWSVFADIGVSEERATFVLQERPETLERLRRGIQTVVLRRAGTKENAFGAVGDLVLLVPERTNSVDLAGRVEAAIDVESAEQIEALRRIHPGAEEDARDRFQWRGPGQPLRALILRVFSIDSAALPEGGDIFGDWIELSRSVPAASRFPVLGDDEFLRAMEDVRFLLTREPEERKQPEQKMDVEAPSGIATSS